MTKPLAPPWSDSGKLVPRALALAASGRHEIHVLVPAADRQAWPPFVRAHGVHREARDYRPRPLA